MYDPHFVPHTFLGLLMGVERVPAVRLYFVCCSVLFYFLFFIFKLIIAKFMTMMIIFMEGAGSFTEVFRISLESSKVLHFLSAIN